MCHKELSADHDVASNVLCGHSGLGYSIGRSTRFDSLILRVVTGRVKTQEEFILPLSGNLVPHRLRQVLDRSGSLFNPLDRRFSRSTLANIPNPFSVNDLKSLDYFRPLRRLPDRLVLIFGTEDGAAVARHRFASSW